ncbi:hypothetical protein V7138_21540 [Bacillus sp. JJ1533]|uniref:hypothetical protein n=1 Tax=Bacillus sp. JJ1533 TaxID=3122959 RepID=UPI003000D459
MKRFGFCTCLLILLFLLGCSDNEESNKYLVSLEMGIEAFEEERYEDAVSAFKIALDEKPDDMEATEYLVKAEMKLNKNENEDSSVENENTVQVENLEQVAFEYQVNQVVEDSGISVSVEKLVLIGQELYVYMTVDNKRDENIRFRSYDQVLLQDGQQFEADDTPEAINIINERISYEIYPGYHSTGIIVFPLKDPTKPFSLKFDVLNKGLSSQIVANFDFTLQ